MEKEIIVKIDLERITKDILEKETYADGYTGYGIIEQRAKDEIKQWIKDSIVNEIKAGLNIEEFREKNCYTQDYLKAKANNILDETFSELVKKHTEEWVKKNMRWVVEHQAEKNIEEFLLPRLQKMISNLLVVNTEVVDAEMNAIKEDYENQLKEMEDK